MSLKKEGKNKQMQANPLKPKLMSQTCNPWNPRPTLNKKISIPNQFNIERWNQKKNINLKN